MVTHARFDVGKLRLVRGMGREVLAMAEYEPIQGPTEGVTNETNSSTHLGTDRDRNYT